jgi:hypothetical protein
MKKPFNPNDYLDSVITVKELSQKFPKLLTQDYKKISLLNELIALNYEIISKDYVDFFSSNIEDYFHFEVDAVI